MTHADIIKLCGSPTQAAIALGVTLQTLRNWRKGIPARSQMWIEAKTSGALRRDIAAKRNGKAKP